MIAMVMNIPACIESGCMIWEFDDKQDAIIQYINEGTAELKEIENDFLESYSSVTGENYTSDLETYTEFTNNTICLAEKYNVEIQNE